MGSVWMGSAGGTFLLVKRKQKANLEAQIKQILGEALARTHPTQETLFGERFFQR